MVGHASYSLFSHALHASYSLFTLVTLSSRTLVTLSSRTFFSFVTDSESPWDWLRNQCRCRPPSMNESWLCSPWRGLTHTVFGHHSFFHAHGSTRRLLRFRRGSGCLCHHNCQRVLHNRRDGKFPECFLISFHLFPQFAWQKQKSTCNVSTAARCLYLLRTGFHRTGLMPNPTCSLAILRLDPW